MQYKLIAGDMDGTLLDPQMQVRETTIKAIEKAMEQGIIFTVATGRPFAGVERYEALYKLLKAPVITYNGAVILNPQDKSVLYERLLDSFAAETLISMGKASGTTVLIWSKGELYIYEHTVHTEFYAEMTRSTPIIIKGEQDEKMLAQQGITKLLLYGEPERIARTQEKIEKAKLKNVACCTSHPSFLETFHSDASKGEALKFLAEYLGISPSEIIAIGDEMNDISMLKFAGLGIAMGNAHPAAKAVADFITLKNGEDGVAHAINTFV